MWNAHRFEEFDRAHAGFAPGRTTVDNERFGDLIAHGEDRVQGRHGLLVDERDFGAPDRAHFCLWQRQEVASLEPDAPATGPTRRLDEPQDRQRRDRLPTPRFANQPQRFTGPHFEADIVHHRGRAGVEIEHGGQVLDREEGLHLVARL